MSEPKNRQQEGRLMLNEIKASSYSPNTLISNWFEDLESLERQLQEFQRKQQNGELKVQRTRKTFYNLFKTLPFDQGNTRHVKYGGEFLIATTGSWSGKPLYVKSDPARAVRPGNELNHGTVTFGAVQDRYSTKRKAWNTLNHDNTNQGLQACRGASLKGQMVEGIIQG
ncbi:unnamed protein product, partial [Nesidiocoris tenuis]